MSTRQNKTGIRSLAAFSIMGLLAACGSDNNFTPAQAPEPAPLPPPATQTFEVSVVNLTASQPFSPIAVVAHTNEYSAFAIGEPASAGLELLAEDGDNSDFMTEADSDNAVIMTLSAEGALPPGNTAQLSFTLEESQLSGLLVSAVTMLVNTNDAITAARNMSLEGMEVGDRRVVTTITYDSGTEANTEAVGTIPGPADGGEGFNAARDDRADRVTAHPGAVTADGGLAGSALTEIHRWDNPVARVFISRTE